MYRIFQRRVQVLLMRKGANVAVLDEGRRFCAENGTGADDICKLSSVRRASSVDINEQLSVDSVSCCVSEKLSSEDTEKTSPSNGITIARSTFSKRSRCAVLFSVVQKVNMCLIVMFVVYFVWTISSIYGNRHSMEGAASGNQSALTNHTPKVGHFSIFSGFVDVHSSGTRTLNESVIEQTNTSRLTISESSRRLRKHQERKNRNRTLNMRAGVQKDAPTTMFKDDSNLEDSPNSHKTPKNICNECTISKRKGRKSLDVHNLSPTLLRKILEKVADDTLSGARSGDGTISSIVGDRAGAAPSERVSTGWSQEQHWREIAEGELVLVDNTERDSVIGAEAVSPWSPWSPCSTSCGAGQQERMRKCGSACTEVESMVCLQPTCADGSAGGDSSAISEFYRWEGVGFMPPLEQPDQQDLDTGEDVCSKWVKCYSNFAQDFIRNASLPGCPCFFPLVRVKTKVIYDVKLGSDVRWVDISKHADLVYKPGARACMRSTLAPGTLTLAVQQCCYDDDYSLVTRGSAAGTPMLISPDISQELHYKIDLLPWIICKGDWTKYNEVISPNNAFHCGTNPDDEGFNFQKSLLGNY